MQHIVCNATMTWREYLLWHRVELLREQTFRDAIYLSHILWRIPLWGIVFILFVGFAVSCVYFFGTEGVGAPVLKALGQVKHFFLKSLPELIIASTATLKRGSIIFGEWILRNWEFWTLKKISGTIARSAAFNFIKGVIGVYVIAKLEKNERRWVYVIPQFLIIKIKKSRLRYLSKWWKKAPLSIKKIIYGLVICLVFVWLGDSQTGVAILAIDIIWEGLKFIAKVVGPFMPKVVTDVVLSVLRFGIFRKLMAILPTLKEWWYALAVRKWFVRRKWALMRRSVRRRRKTRERAGRLLPPLVKAAQVQALFSNMEHAVDKDARRKTNLQKEKSQ